MIDLVYNKLKELGYEVYWQIRPKNFPSLTFSFISESGKDFADDKEITAAVVCQIDIWSKGDYTELSKKVKSKMREIEFYRSSEYDDFEEDTKIYHKVLRFNYLKTSEEESI